MLRPNKHSDPKLTVLPVAGALLKTIRKKRTCSIPELRKVVEKLGDDRLPLLLPSVSLLYLLGTVEYRCKTDSVEYVGQ